jgi:hypothetical protein
MSERFIMVGIDAEYSSREGHIVLNRKKEFFDLFEAIYWANWSFDFFVLFDLVTLEVYDDDSDKVRDIIETFEWFFDRLGQREAHFFKKHHLMRIENFENRMEKIANGLKGY